MDGTRKIFNSARLVFGVGIDGRVKGGDIHFLTVV
jgi:hypothetical protein